jgi:type VI secretion system protein ImpH
MRQTMDPADDRARIDPLLARGPQFGFFQAMRQLEAALAGHARVGHLGPPQAERIRLRPNLSLSFATGDIASIDRLAERPGEASRYELVTGFLGIYGVSSPLPSYITEDLMGLEEHNPLQRRFLDLFNHRLLSLFYRAWQKYRCSDADMAGPDGAYTKRLLLLLGLHHLPDACDGRLVNLQLIRFAELLTQHPRSALSLETCLRRFFPGIPIEVQPCIAVWTPIPPDQRSRLGLQGVSLGEDFWLGEDVCNRSTTFRVAIGPVDYRTFRDFLPGAGRRHELEALVAVFNQDGLDCEISIAVRIGQHADGDGDGGKQEGFASVRLGDASHLLGLNVRLGDGDDDPDAIHLVSSVIAGQP